MALRNFKLKLHIFLDIFELRNERRRKKFRKNCFDNVVSDLQKNCFMCPPNYFGKKCTLIFIFFFFTLLTFLINDFFFTNIWIIPQIWEHIFKQFYLNFFFLLKSQNCLETCLNCVWNCVMPLFTPLEVQFSIISFFKNVLLPHLKC